MQLLFRTAGDFTLDGIQFLLSVRTDGVTTEVVFDQVPLSYTGETANPVKVTYGNAVQVVSIGSRTGGSLTFPYDGTADRITLSGVSFVYGGASLGTTAVFRWGTVFGITQPTADFNITGPEYLDTVTISFTPHGPAGTYPVMLDLHSSYNLGYGWEFEMRLSVDRSKNQSQHKLESYYGDGDQLRYTYLVAYYATEEAAAARSSDYLAVAEYDSPVYTCSSGGRYFYPYDLTWTSPVRRGRVTVRWGAFTDMTGVFELQRSADGGDWVTIYQDASNHFTDTIGDWQSVAYRVRSRRSATSTFTSGWVTGETVEVGQSNVYVGIGGVPTPASAIYLGSGMSPVTPMFSVGGAAL